MTGILYLTSDGRLILRPRGFSWMVLLGRMIKPLLGTAVKGGTGGFAVVGRRLGKGRKACVFFDRAGPLEFWWRSSSVLILGYFRTLFVPQRFLPPGRGARVCFSLTDFCTFRDAQTHSRARLG